MFRFYFHCRPRSTDELSPASLSTWEACDASFRELEESEQDIVRSYYVDAPDKRTRPDPMQSIAEKYSLTITETKAIIDRAIRIAVVSRGLADE